MIITTHPDYASRDYTKFRDVLDSGKDFVEKYLETFSSRETPEDFAKRKKISYTASHAKAAIMDIRNAIYQRMVDIVRIGGPDSYKEAILKNVDGNHSNMNAFIGCTILPELLFLGKVGVCIDRPIFKSDSKAEAAQKKPYLYYYRAEQIRNWVYDNNNRLIKLLVQKCKYTIDDESGLISGVEDTYRFYNLEDGRLKIINYDTNGDYQDEYDSPLKSIPFVIFDIGVSLLTDVADYQIAMTNMASSDIVFCLKSNFPFYTEQQDIRTSWDGDKNPEGEKDKTVRVGATQGRIYGKDMERPDFIHPSPEPLKASMEKQEVLKREIRELINVNLQNINPTRSSVEVKKYEEKGVESNLAYVGLELERGENEIARIWGEYESSEPAQIRYPINYSMRDDAQRRAEAKELQELQFSIPSKTYQKAVAKTIVTTLVGHKVSNEDLQKMHKEIDEAEVLGTNPEEIRGDVESGLVSIELASKLRGYPPGEDIKAKEDHAERLKRIEMAQSGGGARGTDPTDKQSGKIEKQISQSADKNKDAQAKKVRT